MDRWDTESTAEIDCRDLGQLLDTMAREQAITARIRLSDIRAAQAEELARDAADTTPMPRRNDEPARLPLRARKQTLPLTITRPPVSDARIETPMLALGSAAVPAQPVREVKGIAVSIAVAAVVLMTFFAIYFCV